MSIQEVVVDILENQIGVAATAATPDANLIKDLGIDSLDYAELLMEFEQRFKIRIPDSDAELLTTVGDAVKYIEQKMQA